MCECGHCLHTHSAWPVGPCLLLDVGVSVWFSKCGSWSALTASSRGWFETQRLRSWPRPTDSETVFSLDPQIIQMHIKVCQSLCHLVQRHSSFTGFSMLSLGIWAHGKGLSLSPRKCGRHACKRRHGERDLGCIYLLPSPITYAHPAGLRNQQK